MPEPQAVIQSVAQIAYAIILLLVPLLVKLLYPKIKEWIDAKVGSAQSTMSRDEIWLVQSAAAIAVSSVEQLKKTNGILNNAQAFAAAQTILQNWLSSRGILLDMTELRAAIESAVNDLPHAEPPAAAPPTTVINVTGDSPSVSSAPSTVDVTEQAR